MRKNFTLLFLFLFTCLSSIWAGPVTEDNARRTAEDFFRTLSPSMTRGAVSMKLVYQPALARSAGGEAEYFVFAPDTLGGFVVVSGDDQLTPIVGYSLSGASSGTRIPDALKAWLDDYVRYVRDVRSGSAKVYARDISLTRAGGKAIEPMVATKWDQGRPYNDQCPVMGQGKAPSGCVATAMAQIMKFHNWPDVGEGEVTYYDYNQGNVKLDLSKSRYDWKEMLDVYDYSWGENGEFIPGYTSKQGEAVAKLMHECGRTVNMEYAYAASGAITSCVAAALVDNFKYSPQARYYYRNVYTTDAWVKLIRENLELRQPILYSGDGEGGGHAFVCDGIDARDFVHINWGWSGYFDGYFDMSYLVPEGVGTGGGSGSYFDNQGVVAGIRPRVAGEVVPPVSGLVVQNLHLQGETSYPLQDKNQFNFETPIDKMFNASGRRQSGVVGFCVQRDGVWQSPNRGMSINMASNIYYYGIQLSFSVTTDPASEGYLAPGSHELKLCYKPDGQEEWIPIEGGSGANGVIVDLTDSEIKVRLNKEVKPAQISLVSVVPPAGDLYAMTYSKITLLLRNTGFLLPNSNIYYALIPEGKGENLTTQEIEKYIKGYSIPYVYENTVMEVYLKCEVPEAGKYRVRLYSWDPNTVTYMPLPEDSPQYVTFISLPKKPIPLLTMSLNILSEIEQGPDAWVSYTAYMKTVSQEPDWYTGKLALYATKKGDTSGKEYKLLEQDVRIKYSEMYVEGTYGTTKATVGMEPGEYVAYLKYDAGNGEMVKVTPDEYNTASFVLKESSIPLLSVSAPIVVNGGKDVVRGSSGEVEVTIRSHIDYSGKLYLQSGTKNEAGEYTWIFTPSGEIPTVTLKAGVPATFRLPYYCNPEAILGDHKVEFIYGVGEYFYVISLGEYESTCGFTVVESSVDQGLRLNSPLIVNGGNDVLRGSKGQIRFSLISGDDFTGEFYPISLSDAGYVMNGTSKWVTLQANVPQEVTLEYECSADSELGQQKLTIYYLLDGVPGSNALDYGEYEASSYFNVAISTGIEDTPLSGCTLIARPDAFLLKGVVPGSFVHVTALDGRVLFEGTAADVEMSIPMSGVASGLYIVTVKTPDGEMKALKGRRR